MSQGETFSGILDIKDVLLDINKASQIKPHRKLREMKSVKMFIWKYQKLPFKKFEKKVRITSSSLAVCYEIKSQQHTFDSLVKVRLMNKVEETWKY